MTDIPLVFTLVPHQYEALDHQLEVGYFLADFFFSSVLGSFMGTNEELGRSREVLKKY